MSPFRGCEDGLDIETVPGGFILTNAPDLVDDGIPGHEPFSHEFLRDADYRKSSRQRQSAAPLSRFKSSVSMIASASSFMGRRIRRL